MLPYNTGGVPEEALFPVRIIAKDENGEIIEEWGRQAAALPRVDDLITRHDRAYIVIAVTWFDGGRTSKGLTVIAPAILVRESP